jgi:hypothetical protein
MHMPEVMPFRNKMMAFVISLGLLLLIVELVRRRKLREEYSWLWLLTGSFILLLMMWFGLLKWFTLMIGAVAPSSTIYFFALVFLFFISLHFSVVISKLTGQIKELAQKNAFLELELEELKKREGNKR